MFLKEMKFLREIRKTFKADQPLLVVCFSAKFILLKSVFLSAKFLVSVMVKFHFVNTAKLLL